MEVLRDAGIEHRLKAVATPGSGKEKKKKNSLYNYSYMAG